MNRWLPGAVGLVALVAATAATGQSHRENHQARPAQEHWSTGATPQASVVWGRNWHIPARPRGGEYGPHMVSFLFEGQRYVFQAKPGSLYYNAALGYFSPAYGWWDPSRQCWVDSDENPPGARGDVTRLPVDEESRPAAPIKNPTRYPRC